MMIFHHLPSYKAPFWREHIPPDHETGQAAQRATMAGIQAAASILVVCGFV